MKFEGLNLILRHFPTQDEVEDKVSCEVNTPSVLESSKEEVFEITKQLKYFVERFGVKKIYTSDSVQALETAQLIANVLKLEVIATKLLRNIKRPQWENLTNSQVKEKFKTDFEIWCNKPANVKFEGGECLDDVKKRVELFCSLYHEPKIIITHTSTFHMFVLKNFNLDLNYAWDFKPEMYCFTVLFEGTLWALNTRSLDYLTLDYK